MIVSLELGKNKIFAVLTEGKQILHRLELDVKSVDGSRIADPEECAAVIRDALAECGEKVKQCVFTLPMNMAFSKEMTAPKNLSDKNLVSFVATNLQNVLDINENEFVTDRVFLDGDGEMDLIFGAAMRRELVEKCMTIAKLCKLQCIRIDLRMNVVYQYMKRRGLLADQACMVVRVTGNSAEIYLFEEKRMYSRTAELSGEGDQDTDNLLKNWAVSFNDSLVSLGEKTEKTSSLTDKLENIRNFQLTRNRRKPVEHIYFYGDTEDIQLEELQSNMGLNVLCLTEPEDMMYIVPIAAADGDEDEDSMDLLRAYRRSTPKETAQKGFLMTAAAGVASVFVIFLMITLFFIWQNNRLDHKIEEIQTYLTSTETAAQILEAQQISRQLKAQKQYNEVLKQFNETFQTQFRYHSVYIDGVLQLAQSYGVDVNYYDYSNGELKMTCTAPNSSVAAMYSKIIEESGWASDVTFVSYERGDSGNDGLYAFNVKGSVKETL